MIIAADGGLLVLASQDPLDCLALFLLFSLWRPLCRFENHAGVPCSQPSIQDLYLHRLFGRFGPYRGSEKGKRDCGKHEQLLHDDSLWWCDGNV